MTFQQARAAMALGLKVFHYGWNPEEIVYMFLRDETYWLQRFNYMDDKYGEFPIPTVWLENYNLMPESWEIYREPKTSTSSSDARTETSQRKVE